MQVKAEHEEERLDKRLLQSAEISKMYDRKKKVKYGLDKKSCHPMAAALIQWIRKASIPG